ncbi:MAG: ParB/RepB/Spo0J family partition protein [Sneathiellaceae bacterium]
MTKRHDALFDDVLKDLPAEAPRPEQARGEAPNRGGQRFLKRSNAIAERASGEVVDQVLRWVAPDRCRMWPRHNRRYELLNDRRCADLIEGFKAQGRQEFPAVVRRLKDDPDHDFEVICGARRHWTVSWLRAHNYPQFRFLIEVRELTDEEAFRLSDIENRDREDISDYERATDYADALGRYYEGRQKAMAERLEVSEAWLSRFLLLAKLPKAIIDAYADVTELREHHARELRPLLGDARQRERVLEAARAIAAEQKQAAAGGQPLLPGPEVLKKLKAAAQKPQKTRSTILGEYRSQDGKVALTARRKGRGVQLDIASGAELDELLALCRQALEAHLPRKR